MLALLSISCSAQTTNLACLEAYRQYGIVVTPLYSNTAVIGSAVVLGPSNDVVTCYHLFQKAQETFGESKFSFLSSTETYQLNPKVFLTNYDFVICSTIPLITNVTPFKIANLKQITPGQTIIYIGFDYKLSDHNELPVVNVATSVVSSLINKIDTTNSTGAPCFTFTGVAKQGYSGGPVFDLNSRVLGLIRQNSNELDMAGVAGILQYYWITNRVKRP